MGQALYFQSCHFTIPEAGEEGLFGREETEAQSIYVIPKVTQSIKWPCWSLDPGFLDIF